MRWRMMLLDVPRITPRTGILLLLTVSVLLGCSQNQQTAATTYSSPPSTASPTATAIPLVPTALPTPLPSVQPPKAAVEIAKPTPSPARIATLPTPTPGLFPLVISDSLGRKITFDRPLQRIIPYDSAAVEILYAIGEGERVVGTHSFANYPPEVSSVPKLGSAFSINLEEVVAAQPDLVYLFYDRFLADLEGAGLRVLYLKSLSANVNDVLEHIRLWGNLTGNVESSQLEIDLFRAKLNILEAKLKDVDRGPRVYNHTFGFWTPGPDTLTGDIFKLLKAETITGDISGYAQISPEQLVARDPEAIITSPDAVAELNNASALKGMTAIKNNRILVPERGPLSTAGPRLISVIEEIAEFLYPEIFS